ACVVHEAEVDDVHGDLRVVAGLEDVPDLLLQVAARRRLRGRGIRLAAERVGVPSRDAKEPAVRRYLHGVRAAERLRDDDVPALLEGDGVPARDLDRLDVARELRLFHRSSHVRPILDTRAGRRQARQRTASYVEGGWNHPRSQATFVRM